MSKNPMLFTDDYGQNILLEFFDIKWFRLNENRIEVACYSNGFFVLTYKDHDVALRVWNEVIKTALKLS